MRPLIMPMEDHWQGGGLRRGGAQSSAAGMAHAKDGLFEMVRPERTDVAIINCAALSRRVAVHERD